MAKIINVDEDGMIAGVEPSPQGFLFEFREVEVRGLDGLAQAIATAARDPTPSWCGQAEAGYRATRDV